MHKPAREPNDLERFFVERANTGDVEGLVTLYEANAMLVSPDGEKIIGTDQIRKFFTDYLKEHPKFSPSIQAPARCSGDIALTSSRHSSGDISVEIARRQANGNWLWVVDQFALTNKRYSYRAACPCRAKGHSIPEKWVTLSPI